MKVVVGLGNPENKYKGTRHNAGFEVINKLAYDHNISVTKAKFSAYVGEGFIHGPLLLVKPQTYMNNSGESVREILRYYKLAPADLLVIYDDISIDVGQIRIRERGSAGSHNGMKSILYHLESDEFIRVRVGIGAKPKEWDLIDHVLGRFTDQEFKQIVEGYTKAGEAVELIMKGEISKAMNHFNKKQGEGA